MTIRLWNVRFSLRKLVLQFSLSHITILFKKFISLSYQFLKFYIRDENLDTNLKFLILGKLNKPTIYLTNRFHVAVRVFSNRSQMTSKCGRTKTWHTRRQQKNLRLRSTLEAIRFELWMRRAFLNSDSWDLCPLWLAILKSVWYWVLETPYSCDTVGREQQWAILCLLLCPETDWKNFVGKQGYVFILTDFKKWSFDVLFPTSNCVNRPIFETVSGNYIFIGYWFC